MMSAQAMADTYFVAPVAKGAANGSSWENAMAPGEWNFLAGDVVYLAEGTYNFPAITLVNGVQYIGGFAKDAKGTDVSDYDPESYVTKLTPLNSNTAQFLTLKGDSGQTETLLKGVTITGVAGTQDATVGSLKGSVALLQKAWLTMQDVIVTDNATRCGGIIVAESSVLKCRRCVFSNNVQEMKYENGKAEDNKVQTPNASILFNLRGNTATTNCVLVLDECAIYGNRFANSELMANATDGGLINSQSGAPHHVIMVNNYIDGNGIKCHSKAAFMRTNGGTAAKHAVAMLAYNTIYNFSVSERFATGNVITIGGHSSSFVGGNIIVSPIDYDEFEIGKGGTGEKNVGALEDSMLNPTEGSTSNQCLTYGNVSATTPARWIGAGYNFVGGRTMIKRGNYWVEPQWSVTKKYETGDNWKVLNQSEVFGENQPYTDGYTAYIEPVTGKDLDKVNTAAMAEAWNCEEWINYLKEDEGMAKMLDYIGDIDLGNDITGRKRGATSWSGCYDATAVQSGVSDLAGNTLKLVKTGEGIYEVKGASASVTAFDMSGRCVARGNNRIDLNGAAKGVYMIKAGSMVAKIVL